MYEPITVVKVRAARNVTVPAGGWVILCSPDQPLSEHIAARRKLVQRGNVSDDFSTLLIGRIQDVSSPTRFVTQGQAAEHAKVHAEAEARLKQSHADALQRQKDMAEKTAQAARKEHEAKVARLNREHDQIRVGRDTVAAPVVSLEFDDAAVAAAEKRAQRAADLEKKSVKELISIIDAMNAEPARTVKITLPAEAKKDDIIVAILTAPGA